MELLSVYKKRASEMTSNTNTHSSTSQERSFHFSSTFSMFLDEICKIWCKIFKTNSDGSEAIPIKINKVVYCVNELNIVIGQK